MDDERPQDTSPGEGGADAGQCVIDACGLLCPLPVLRLRKRLSQVPAGRIVCLLADDPAARVDVPHFCQEAGHTLLEATADGATLRFVLRKGG